MREGNPIVSHLYINPFTLQDQDVSPGELELSETVVALLCILEDSLWGKSTPLGGGMRLLIYEY